VVNGAYTGTIKTNIELNNVLGVTGYEYRVAVYYSGHNNGNNSGNNGFRYKTSKDADTTNLANFIVAK
jgi:hypothetical protein